MNSKLERMWTEAFRVLSQHFQSQEMQVRSIITGVSLFCNTVQVLVNIQYIFVVSFTLFIICLLQSFEY
jgi:hypothetical protein